MPPALREPSPEPDEPWRVFRVFTGHELDVRGFLFQREVDAYAPVYREKRTWSRQRTRVFEVPLFPGYVFAHFELARKGELVQRIPFLLELLSFGGAPAELSCAEIQRVQLMARGENIMQQDGIAIGQLVRVVRGPMMGLEGVVQMLRGATRVCLPMEIFNRTVSAELDRADIEPISRMSLVT